VTPVRSDCHCLEGNSHSRNGRSSCVIHHSQSPGYIRDKQSKELRVALQVLFIACAYRPRNVKYAYLRWLKLTAHSLRPKQLSYK
jgi:hypothetical protein